MIFLLGGVRSGKSLLAEKWAARLARNGLYLATGIAMDNEMAARITAHRQRRGDFWECLEEAEDPEKSLKAHLAQTGQFSGAMLFDCVSGWVANLLHAGFSESEILEKAQSFFLFLSRMRNPALLVSLECGCGIIPENRLARMYGDILGLVNQTAALLCSDVALVSCGLPVWLKGGNIEAISGKEPDLEHNSQVCSKPLSGASHRKRATFCEGRRRPRRLHRGNRHSSGGFGR